MEFRENQKFAVKFSKIWFKNWFGIRKYESLFSISFQQSKFNRRELLYRIIIQRIAFGHLTLIAFNWDWIVILLQKLKKFNLYIIIYKVRSWQFLLNLSYYLLFNDCLVLKPPISDCDENSWSTVSISV